MRAGAVLCASGLLCGVVKDPPPELAVAALRVCFAVVVMGC
jgi:hypothetical protein